MRTGNALLFAIAVSLAAAAAFAIDPHFRLPVDYTVGSDPEEICSADFNADGKPDLAVVNSLSNSVSVLINNGDGTFAAPVDYTVGAHPSCICAIDVDDDGLPDLAIGNYGAATVTILFNLPAGGFDLPFTYSTGLQPTGICTADFNSDLRADLAVSCAGSGGAVVMLNLNNESFPTAVTYLTGLSPSGVCVIDANIDGKADLAVSNLGDDNMSLLVNNGDGTFATAVNSPVGLAPASIASLDMNGNALPDIATTNSGDGTISVLNNTGGGNFAGAVNYAVGSFPDGIVLKDLDKDGKPDLGACDPSWDSVSVLRNNGDGTFGTALNHVVGLASGAAPVALCAADFNSDTWIDLAVANSSLGSVSVLFNVKQHTISASNGAHGTIVPSGQVRVYDSTDQAFSIVPATGYHVATVTVDGSPAVADTTFTFVMVTGNHTINATFAINTYTLTASSGLHGSVTPAGASTVNYGDSKAYTISPDACYHVQDVLVDGISVGPVPAYTFTAVDTNHTISATFAVDVETITATAGPNGSITPSGAVPVNCGSDQAFDVIPNPGFYVGDVKVNGGSVGKVTHHVITNVTANMTIDASFTCCGGRTGNVNCDSSDGVDVGDLTALIDNLFIGFTPLCCADEANCDGLGGVDVGDLTALIDNLFINFTVLAPCQ